MDLQRQQLVLEHEIRLLEQQKENITRDLDQIEASKKAEYTQYTGEIKRLKTQRNDLMEAVEKLKETHGAIMTAYEDAKKELAAFREQQLKDVEEIVTTARENARVMTESANKESIRLQGKEANISQRERLLEEELQSFYRERALHKEEYEKMQEQQFAWLSKKEDREDLLRDLDIKVNKSTHDLEQSIQKRKEIDATIASDSQQLENNWSALRKREREIERNEKASDQRQRMLTEKEEALKQKEEKLSYQAKAVQQAIADLQQKGVTL